MKNAMRNVNCSGSDLDQVIVSEHNALGDNRYFDSASQTSFQVDHASQVCPTNPSSILSNFLS